MNLFFSGIGGIGISALAQYCLTRGDTVCGSEIAPNEITKKLEKLGVRIHVEQKAENVSSEVDCLIYTEAVPPTNPERLKADELGIPQKSYFEYLGEVSKTKRTIAVAGTHGKTTTVGMIAAGFQACGFDATTFIGSTLPEFDGANFHAGTNDWLLVEACEYRNNFQFLEPEVVVLTNAEYDHPDAYESEEAYLDTMRNFVCKATMVVTHYDDPDVQEVLGASEGIELPTQKDYEETVELSVSGVHNRKNAELAIRLAYLLELDIDTFRQGLKSFSGTGRRQEYLGEKDGIHIYDDYGHHPTAIRVTLEGFREQYPDAKIALIYEPHQYSRTREFKDEFIEAFGSADVFGLYPIYEARDTEADKASISRSDLLPLHKEDAGGSKVDDLSDVQNLCQNLNPGDVLVFMGAGKISQFARSYLQS